MPQARLEADTMKDVQTIFKIPTDLKGEKKKLTKKVLKKGIEKIIPIKLFQLPKKARTVYEDILTDVVFADLLKTSVEVVGSSFEGPSQDRVMDYLNVITPQELEKLNKECTKEIAFKLRKLRRYSFNAAIDFTYIPYYGNPDNHYVTGIKNSKGTNYAFVFCVLSVVVDGVRNILYVYPVTKDTNKVAYHVKKAINFIKEFGIRISILFLDREFYSEEVVNFLNESPIHYIIPAIQTGKFLRYTKMYSEFPFSLPIVLEGWRIENSKTKEIAETNLAIIKEIDEKGKVHIYGFITNLSRDRYSDDITLLSDLYSKRWGIETAFRVEDKFDIHTTTRNGIVRHFFFSISCILYNFWITINFIKQTKNVDNGSFEITVKVDELRIVLIHLFEHKFRHQKFNQICELLATAILENEKKLFFVIFVLLQNSKTVVIFHFYIKIIL